MAVAPLRGSGTCAAMRNGATMRNGAAIVGLVVGAIVGLGQPGTVAAQQDAGVAKEIGSKQVSPELKPFQQEVASTAYKIDMLPIPASKDGKIGPLWMSKTEITWDAFDVYAFNLDEGEPGGKDVDAVSRPTKPYLPPDRGLGHEGFAAISVGFKNAQEFCSWLSARTGKHYRLATEAEWQYACRAGSSKVFGVADDAAGLKEYAWFADDSDGAPHEVAKKKPNAWGLYDMQGNVLEWVVGSDGQPTTCGGSWRDTADQCKPESTQKQDPSWNKTDPQVPKSKWWLSDGPMVGFRVVCEVEKGGGEKKAEGK